MRIQRKIDRTEQLKRLRERYQGRGKEGKSRLLTEFCEQYDYERKYAIKLLGADPEGEHRSSPPGPEPKYDGVTEVITQVWQAAEQICGKTAGPRVAALVAALMAAAFRSDEFSLLRNSALFAGQEKRFSGGLETGKASAIPTLFFRNFDIFSFSKLVLALLVSITCRVCEEFCPEYWRASG